MDGLFLGINANIQKNYWAKKVFINIRYISTQCRKHTQVDAHKLVGKQKKNTIRSKALTGKGIQIIQTLSYKFKTF